READAAKDDAEHQPRLTSRTVTVWPVLTLKFFTRSRQRLAALKKPSQMKGDFSASSIWISAMTGFSRSCSVSAKACRISASNVGSLKEEDFDMNWPAVR